MVLQYYFGISLLGPGLAPPGRPKGRPYILIGTLPPWGADGERRKFEYHFFNRQSAISYQRAAISYNTGAFLLIAKSSGFYSCLPTSRPFLSSLSLQGLQTTPHWRGCAS